MCVCGVCRCGFSDSKGYVVCSTADQGAQNCHILNPESPSLSPLFRSWCVVLIGTIANLTAPTDWCLGCEKEPQMCFTGLQLAIHGEKTYLLTQNT